VSLFAEQLVQYKASPKQVAHLASQSNAIADPTGTYPILAD